MRQSLKLFIYLSLIIFTFSYSLEGAWDLTSSSQFPSLSDLTFQFTKTVDGNGNITSKLFVYNCFISQFLYKVQDSSLSFDFQVSSFLQANCSLNQINTLRSLMQTIFYFDINYDNLSLQGLNRQSVFQLVRQKINYTSSMVGAWQLQSGSKTTTFPVRINGTQVYFCQNINYLTYSISTINGSYPQLLTQSQTNSNCPDLQFYNNFTKSSFFQISSNRSQLTVFDSTKNQLFIMNQVGKLNSTLPLVVSATSAISSVNNQQKNVAGTNIPAQSPFAITQTNNQNNNPPITPQKSSSNTPIIQNEPTPPATQSTFSFNFDQSNQFNGEFSSVGLFPSTISSNPTSTFTQAIQTPQVEDTSNANFGQQVSLTDTFFNQFGSNFQSFGSQPQTPQLNQPSLSVEPSPSPSPPNLSTSSPIILSGIPQTIGTSLTQNVIIVPLIQFVQSNKWQVVWLNGVNIPSSLSRVYIIFTSAKIILYCPCNTYYTNYSLNGTSLVGINWLGTSNTCSVNNDQIITNYIFYATSLRQNSSNLDFYYKGLARMASFQPYF